MKVDGAYNQNYHTRRDKKYFECKLEDRRKLKRLRCLKYAWMV
jgi:hypothetical protein